MDVTLRCPSHIEGEIDACGDEYGSDDSDQRREADGAMVPLACPRVGEPGFVCLVVHGALKTGQIFNEILGIVDSGQDEHGRYSVSEPLLGCLYRLECLAHGLHAESDKDCEY